MRGTYGIGMAALGLAAAATLPAPARADERWNPQQEARIEQLIEQAVQGNGDADRQEQARIERLVQQALQHAAAPAVRPVETAQASRVPLARTGIPGR
jgi:hypothetical protein